MGDGRQNFINTIANIVNEGKANINEDKQTITFKSKHWEESRERIVSSGPQGALFLFSKAEDHLRGVYSDIKKRLN